MATDTWMTVVFGLWWRCSYLGFESFGWCAQSYQDIEWCCHQGWLGIKHFGNSGMEAWWKTICICWSYLWYVWKALIPVTYANMLLIDICVYNTKEWRKVASLEDGHYDVSIYALEHCRRSWDLYINIGNFYIGMVTKWSLFVHGWPRQASDYLARGTKKDSCQAWQQGCCIRNCMEPHRESACICKYTKTTRLDND